MVPDCKASVLVFYANILIYLTIFKSGFEMQHRMMVIIKIITNDSSLEARILSETKGLPQLETALVDVLTR